MSPKVGQGVSLHADSHASGGSDPIAAALAAAGHPDYAASLIGKHSWPFWHPVRTDRYYMSPVVSVGTFSGAGALTANRLYAVPWPIFVGRVADRIGAYIQTVAAGKSLRLGIYLDNGSCYPGALLLDAGAVAVDTTGLQVLTIAQTLTPQLLWLAFISDGTPALYNTSTQAFCLLGNSDGFTNSPGWYHAQNYGSLPGTFPSASPVADTTLKAVLMRYSS